MEDRTLLTGIPVTTLADSGPGSLRQAILDANAMPGDDTIMFSVTGTINLISVLPNLSTNIDIQGPGPGAASLTVQRGTANMFRIFSVSSGATVGLSRLTVANGLPLSSDSNGRGGGILNLGVLTVSNCTLRDNSAQGVSPGFISGGGIYNEGVLTITNSTLSGNRAPNGFGGGIYNSNGSVTVSNSTLSGSGADRGGGGIYNVGSVTVGNSIFSGNTTGLAGASGASGGGIFNSQGLVTVSNSTLTGNGATSFAGSGGRGGGIYNAGSVTVSNSTLSGNTASLFGGGIYNDSSVTVSNSTLSGNTAQSGGGGGGGIYNVGSVTLTNSTLSSNTTGNAGGGIANSGVLQTRNTVVAGNSAFSGPDVSGNLGSQGHNLIGNSSGGSGFQPTDLVGTPAAPLNPQLGPLDNNGGRTLTHALLSGSPAIDAGNDNVLLPPFELMTDQRGLPRRSGPHVDIGAFELQSPTQLQFSAAGYSVAENGGSATITVTRLGELAGTVTVNYATSNGTATAPADYTAVSGTLTFAPGQTSATFTISIINDTLPEPNETVNLTLSNPTGATLGSPSTAVLTIVDDDLTTLRVASFTPTNTGFVADFTRAIDPAVLNLYDSALLTVPLGPPDVTITGSTTGAVNGSLVIDPANTRITFLRTGTVLPPDTYTVTLRSAANGFKDTSGGLLDGNADGIPGDNYTTTFTVTASTAVIVSVPDFSRGPGQPVNVPASATGLPLTLSNGAGVDSINLTLRYDPNLLTITDVVLGPAMPPNAIREFNGTTPGVLVLAVSSPTALPAGPIDFVTLTAQVPNAAASLYAQKHILDITNLVINDGIIPTRDDDGLAVVSYFGDTTGNGAYSSLDASRALRVAVGLDNGFEPYQLADPVLIADVTGNGVINATDATRILQASLGIPQTQIPPLPAMPPTITPSGPDPLLAFPKRLRGRPGQTITVPLRLDPSDGLESADLAIALDTSRLDVLGVRRGSLTRDFDLFGVNLDAEAGTIRVGLGRSAGPISGRGKGSVVLLALRIRPDAPAGSTILNLRQSVGALITSLNDGQMDLNPDPSDAAGDALDGVITVRGRAARLARDVVFAAPADSGLSPRADLLSELPDPRRFGAVLQRRP